MTTKPKEIDFNDKANKKAQHSGQGNLLPDNVIIRSPYRGGNAALNTQPAEEARGDDNRPKPADNK